MQTATVSDTDILEALDWDFVQPCEHPKHNTLHLPQPAKFLVRRLDPCCGIESYFICASGWKRLGLVSGITCMGCGRSFGGSRDELLLVIKVLGDS